MPLWAAIWSTSFSAHTASLAYSTVLPTIARIMAMSSKPICDGPSSPMLTPTCEPTSLTFAIEIPATRIWSKARVRKQAKVEANGTLPACAETRGHADHALLRDEAFREALRELLVELLGEGGVLGVAIHRHDALVHLADARQRVAEGLARRDHVAELVG